MAPGTAEGTPAALPWHRHGNPARMINHCCGADFQVSSASRMLKGFGACHSAER